MDLLPIEFEQHAFALGAWDNDDGASASGTDDHQYGKWIERDRFWALCNVSSGTTAGVYGRTMTGLTWSEPTDTMLSLSLQPTECQNRSPSPALRALEVACQP